MKIALFQLLCAEIIVHFSNAERSVNMTDVIAESESVIKAQITKENDDFLRKYYFTKDKSKMIGFFTFL